MRFSSFRSRFICRVLAVALTLIASSLHAQNLVSHWNFNGTAPNVGPWGDSVSGGPSMVHDPATQGPGSFNTDQVRLEVDESMGMRTRLSASGASLNINTFSFSMIMDPTDIVGFKTIIDKESLADNNFPDFVRVGWQVQHTGFGNLEFVVRGTQPQLGGGNDFFGNLFVFSTPDPVNNPTHTNMFPEGGNFEDETLYHVAGGYDATTGNMFFYATRLDGNPVTTPFMGDRTTHLSSRTPGAVQDTSPLSLGSRKAGPPVGGGSNEGVDFFDAGAGFDIDDLQIYDSLLTQEQVTLLANNPGLTLDDLAGTPGDFDADGDVDGNDFLEWQRTDGTSGGLSTWQANYPTAPPLAAASAVPEPSTIALSGMFLAMLLAGRKRQSVLV
jgi:hypothetical protein